jgi:hypothetical protein
MQVQITCLRKEGKAYPRWQLANLASYTGELRIEESREENLSRFMRRARLLDHEQDKLEVLPPLMDAAVLWLKENKMAITGFERIESTDYAQTWLVEVLSATMKR